MFICYAATRWHELKLYKNQCNTNTGKQFLLTILLVNRTHCLQPRTLTVLEIFQTSIGIVRISFLIIDVVLKPAAMTRINVFKVLVLTWVIGALVYGLCQVFAFMLLYVMMESQLIALCDDTVDGPSCCVLVAPGYQCCLWWLYV